MSSPQREHSHTRGRKKAALLAGSLAVLFAISTAITAQTVSAKDRALQGQVPLSDQESGRSLHPYKDNMRLIGQSDIGNRGMNGNLGWLDDDDCAYVSAYYGGKDPRAGLATVDASNPRKPRHVSTQPGTPGTRESQVEGNTARRMVVVMPFTATTSFGDDPGPSQLQFYTAGKDCTDLTRRGTYDFGETLPHEHRISNDGKTVYASGYEVTAVDSSDVDNPKLLTTWDSEGVWIHDLDVSPDGKRAYANTSGGLSILDTSEVQARVPNPKIKLVSEIRWDETISHSAQLVNIGGRTYIVAQDEVWVPNKCPYGRARIIDVTDEQNPVEVSTIEIEASKAENCARTLPDNAVYSAHYLGVDSVEDTSMVFMTWYSSGLRAFDIRDPRSPKEIGSYIPGARTDTEFQGTGRYWRNTKVDYAYSFVRYRPETGHIWFNSIYNGFQIVKLNRDLDVLDRQAANRPAR